ncbi:MAG: hypothetical protein IJ794_07720 [Lachnospiraceae bacterium]|nr:hypothetical protein [Lachnospiraceae bacterium]
MQRLYQFSTNFIQVIALISTGFLFLGSFLFTCYATDMTTQKVLTRSDNPLVNLLGMGIFALVLFLVYRTALKHSTKCKTALLVLTMGWILILGGLLILFGRTAPAADAWSVYSAAQALAEGNTSVIHPTDSYLSYYPQQIGLLAFWEPLIRLWNLLPIDLEAYHFIKCIYVVFVCVIVWFQYKSVHLATGSDTADCVYLILAGANLPLIMYSSFVYSEIPSFVAMSVGIYFFLRMLNSKSDTATVSTPSRLRLRSAVLSLLCFTLAVMLRKNSLILIIALVLVTLLESLSRRSIKLLLYGALCIALSVTILPATQKIYELRAGNYLKTGVPAMSYFAMGMQESSRGNGWYNGFNFNTYQESGMDSEVTVQISRDYITERRAFFREHPDYAASFYFYKFLSQWADGTYASRQATLATLGERHAFVREIYDGTYSPYYIGYCNIYQSILYLGSFLCFLHLWMAKSPKRHCLYLYLGIIGAFGGFLFHMIWEANSRYIFLYSLLLLPYAAAGLSALFRYMDLLFGPLWDKTREKPAI